MRFLRTICQVLARAGHRQALFLVALPLTGATEAPAALAWEQQVVETRPGVADLETRAEFRFSNPEAAPVRIVSVTPDCGCTVAALQQSTVAPGEKSHLTATFRFGQRTGLQVHRIKVQVEGEAAPVVLTLRTEIPALLTVQPALALWRAEEPREAKKMQISLAPGLSLKDLKITSLNPAIKVALEGDPSGRDGVLSVQPAPEAAPGVTALDLLVSRSDVATRHFTAYAQLRGPAPGRLASLPPAPALSPTEVLLGWNLELVDAIRNESSSPCISSRHLAIFHLAIEEAVNSCRPQVQSSFGIEAAPPETDSLAAAVGAAETVALALYPSRQAFVQKRLEQETGRLSASSLRWGAEVGRRVVQSRVSDGATRTISYLPHEEAGAWRRTPPFFRPPELPNWSQVRPFVLERADQFRANGPPDWHSERFAQDLAEVRLLGGAQSTVRTPEQEQIARFWSDFSYTAMPPGHWNNIACDLVRERKLPLAEAARLLALVNAAMADAAIACWEAKYTFNTWRPVTALRQSSRLEDPRLPSAPDWLPLLNTPPHPEYPSGHSVFGGASAAVLRSFFGTDQMHLTVTSDTVRGASRSFESFSAAAAECGLSRIYGGIHFRYSVEDGNRCGEAVGTYVAAHLFQPLPN